MRSFHSAAFLTTTFLLLTCGCVHKIHVPSAPAESAGTSIPGTVQVRVPFLALEGADHMPGIVLLKWPAADLQQALVGFFRDRRTFTETGTVPGDWLLSVKGWLTLRAPDHYVYRIHLEADLSRPGRSVLKTYAADGEAVGGTVRWVTSSDEEPIVAATNQAMRELAAQLEADKGRLVNETGLRQIPDSKP